MAPEMLQRRGDARSDIYSLGILLFECLYGDVPFRGDSEWEVLRKHEVAEPEFPPTCNAADREIVRRCLAKRPEDRFTSVGEMLRAMQAPVALGESMMFGGPGAAAAPAPLRPLERGIAGELPPDLPPAAPPTVRAAEATGMPWLPDERARGVLPLVVRAILALMSATIYLVLLPVRAISTFAGRGMVWLLKLPFQILALAARLIGLLVVLALVVLLIVVVISLFAAA
jgi:serine/threonine-protein kinase